MELGPCPHCSASVRSLGNDEFYCIGCLRDVELLHPCGEKIRLYGRKLPKFCCECGLPNDIGSFRRVVHELKCCGNGCTAIIWRKQNGDLPNFCADCGWKIDKSILLHYRRLAVGDAPSPAVASAAVADVEEDRSGTWMSSSAGAFTVPHTGYSDQNEYINDAAPVNNVLESPPPAATLAETLDSSAVASAALKVPLDDGRSRVPLAQTDAAVSPVGEPSLRARRNDGESEEVQTADHPAGDAGAGLPSSSVAELWSPSYYEGEMVSRHLAANVIADKLPDAWNRQPPAAMHAQDMGAVMPPVLSRHGPDYALPRHGGNLADPEGWALPGIDVDDDLSPDFQYHDRRLFGGIRGRFPPFFEPDQIDHPLDNFPDSEGEADLNELAELPLPALMQETVASKPVNVGTKVMNNRSSKRKWRRLLRKDIAHGALDIIGPHAIRAYIDEGPGERYFADMESRQTLPVVPANARHRTVEAMPHAITREHVDVYFHVVISQYFFFEEGSAFPYVELYSTVPGDKPIQKPLQSHSLPSGRQGWMAAIRLPQHLLNHSQPLQYRYFIRCSATSGTEDTYEWIYKQVENEACVKRQLWLSDIPAGKDKWDQYDLVMLPEQYVASDVATVHRHLPQNVSNRDPASKAIRSTRHDGRGSHMPDNSNRTLNENITSDTVFGFESMLPDFMYCLSNGKLKASEIIECYQDVIKCVSNGDLFFLDDANRSVDKSRLNSAICKQLVERAMQQRLLWKQSVDQPVEGDKYSRLLRIASGLILMVLSGMYQCDDVLEHASAILSSLSIADLSQYEIEELLKNHFGKPSNVIKYLQFFMMEAASSGDPSWLCAVPLYHVMQNWAMAYDRRSTKYTNPIWWGLDRELGKCMPSFMAQARLFKVKEWYPRLSPMFRVSWLSARTLVGALNTEQLLCALEDKLQLPFDGYTAAVLRKCLSRGRTQRLTPEEGAHAVECLREILNTDSPRHTSTATEPLRNSMEIIASALHQASNFVDFHGWPLILEASRLFAQLSKIISSLEGRPSDAVLFMGFNDKVMDWLSQVLFFPLADDGANTFKDPGELEMWRLLIAVDWHEKDIRDAWIIKLRAYLQHRLDKISRYSKVALYCLTDFRNSDVEELFSDMALKAADEVMRSTANDIQYGDNDDTIKKFGKIFSHAFNHTWDQQSADDSKKIEFIYTWPRFLTYVSLMCSERAVVLDLKCQSRMTECVKLLNERCTQLKSGIIVYSDLNFMIECGSQFVDICRLLSEKQYIEKNAGGIEKWLELRKQEKSAFDELHENMRTFVSLCERIDKVQLLDLPRRLGEEISKKRLDELWTPMQPDRPGSFECRQFPFTKTVLTPDLLQLVRKVSVSLLFVSYWTNAGKLYLKQREQTSPKEAGLPIELKDVTGFIWTRAYEQYTDFANRLVQGIATFGDADYLIKLCDGDSHNLTARISTEVKHVMQSSPKWKDMYSRVVSYNKLRLYANGASVMRRLKNQFSLQGDFSELDVLITWDQDPTRKLVDITEKLVAAGKRLGAMDDLAKVECLNAFVESKALIDWIKEHVTEPKEVKVFVELASIVAGEGDIEVEKVTCLHAAVMGYSPLIYELPQSADLQTFLEKCEAVWKSLKSNKDLASQLRDTARNIEFIKSVKDSYSAVELKSVAQAVALNEKGTYAVGFGSRDVATGHQSSTLDTVVRATVQGRRRPIASSSEELQQRAELEHAVDESEKNYSYSALSELQSKLMLVAGQAEQDNLEVEEFVKMFRNVTRLGQAYMRANEVGTVLFENWHMVFTNDRAMDGHEGAAFCCVHLGSSREMPGTVEYRGRDPECADRAAKLADFLEKCANEWDIYIREQRRKYRELNFFTIRQIVFLRKELAKCLSDGSLKKNCSNQIYPMLAMLARCDWEDVAEALAASAPQSRDAPGLDIKSQTANKVNDTQVPGHIPASFDELISFLHEKWTEFLASKFCDAHQFISVERLGDILRILVEKRSVQKTEVDKSRFPTGHLARGQPHLIVCPEDDVFRASLSLWMAKPGMPLPTRNEVLVCTEHTSLEEVELLLQRALADDISLYAIIHAQRLNYDICGHIEKRIEDAHASGIQYLIAVICAEESEDRSRIVTALERFRLRRFPIEPLEKLRDFIRGRLTVTEGAGAAVDMNKCSARLIRSNRAGVGKTLYVRRRIAQLKASKVSNLTWTAEPALCIQLLQQRVDLSALLYKLLDKCAEPKHRRGRIIHINIAQEVQYGVDELLFNLLILGSLCHPEGYVWQRSEFDYYAIETVPLLRKVQASDGKNNLKAIHSVLELLPALSCASPTECSKSVTGSTDELWQEMDGQIFESEEWQRTYQYLKRHRVASNDFTNIDASKPEGTWKDMLCVLLEECKLHDPSWWELRNFVSFLNMQLLDCERSAFCSAAAREDLPGFLEFVISFMLEMSRDFATRSLVISEECAESQLTQPQQIGDDKIIKDMEVKRRWEHSAHPYIFFNPDHQTLTFLGFCVERRNGNILVPRTAQILKQKAVAKELFDGLERNNVDLSEDFEAKSRNEKIEKISAVMGNSEPKDPDPTYELTLDNVKKILAIQMRFRCGIPVVIMGETGCGKTRLVKFMCDLQIPASCRDEVKNMILMKVHGGTTAQSLEKKVREAQKLARDVNKHRNIDTVLFLDEANTTDAIGLIKEIMCDGSLNGEFLNANDDRLRIIAAVNPYRKHSPKMIDKLEKAGLGYSVRAEDTMDRFGSIPMRHLVYRVRALPQSMIPLVWDFGRLNPDIEEKYICQMINKHGMLSQSGFREAIARVLIKCQEFMRLQKDECSFVSLRDIDRVLSVMAWFYSKHDLLRNANDRPVSESKSVPFSMDSSMDIDQHASLSESLQSPGSAPILPNLLTLDRMTWSLVLALGVCYHACLQPRKRAEFRRVVASHFRHPLILPQGDRQMLEEINKCQKVIMDSLSDQLPKNIAHNNALKENIFMMIVCLDLRIPLFLVGKPGSSKSLAKVIVADAMQGNSAKTLLFKNLKHVHMVSFQCSPLATPEGIVGTFKQCARFQKNKDLDKFVSVVVLDEVGLAEDSKLMPLKALHPLLEEGCDVDEKPEPYMKCAFIGISNWALDPAKMNRGIHVQRGVPDRKELEDTARGIFEHDGHLTQVISTWIGPLSAAYVKIFEDACAIREFFGLRDFYSLMKMIAHFASQQNGLPTSFQLRHAILRNFGGLESVNVMAVFEKQLHQSLRPSEKTSPDDPPCDAIGLIDSSLTGNYTKMGGESRYLLILTENDTALSLVQSKLEKSKPEVIFGSFFPKDLEYTQVCRNINRIKVCMEAGKTVILLNLENLYESLYDALNQYYVYLAGKRFVDLGLGTHRVKCRVHDDFRLVVIADKDNVLKRFPIPLLNRLEKHYVKMSSILDDRQRHIAERLSDWASQFVKKMPALNLRMGPSPTCDVCEPEEAFVGYSADAVAAVLLQIPLKDQKAKSDYEIYESAKEILLMSATPDAVLRVRQLQLFSEYERIFCNYFKRQKHDSFSSLISSITEQRPSKDMFYQVTTHYKLLSRDDVNHIKKQLGSDFGHFKVIDALQAIDTEQQFSRDIKSFYEEGKKSGLDSLLIVQCEAGHENMKLISCARYILWREYNTSRPRMEDSNNRKPTADVSEPPCRTHVVLIVQLQRKARFFGFHGTHWTCIHIDDLHRRQPHVPAVEGVHKKAISEVLQGGLAGSPQAPPSSSTIDEARPPSEVAFDTYELLRSCLHEAVSRLSDVEGKSSRARRRLDLLIHLFSSDKHQGPTRFQEIFCRFLIRLMVLYENDRFSPDTRVQWLFTDAASVQNVIKFGTFRRSLENCLERKIASFFATIIAFLDTNCNLDLLKPSTSKDDQWISVVWLDIFNGIIHLSSDLARAFANAGVQKYEVPVVCTSASNEPFSPRFPFSWILKGQLDAMIVQLKNSSDVHTRLLSWLATDSAFAYIVLEAKEQQAAMVENYLHDFVHLTFPCKGSRPEIHEIMSFSIKQAMLGKNRETIPGIHLSFSEIQRHAQRLRRLLDLEFVDSKSGPLEKDILIYFEAHPLDSPEMVSDVVALHLILDRLEPATTQQGLAEWSAKMHKCQVLVEEVLSDVGHEVHYSERSILLGHCREKWCRYVLIRLFLVTVVNQLTLRQDLPQLLGEKTVKILSQRLATWSDLLTALKSLEEFLQLCNNDVIQCIYGKHFLDQECSSGGHKLDKDPSLLPCQHPICGPCLQKILCDQTKKEESRCPISNCNRKILNFTPEEGKDEKDEKGERHRSFKQLFNSFFVRVLVELVFSEKSQPGAEVLRYVLKYVAIEHRSGDRISVHTKQLSPFVDVAAIDLRPVIRSFLLQLLLRVSEDVVSEHVSQYFRIMTGVTESYGTQAVLEFCILFIACFEDYIKEKKLGNNGTSATLTNSNEILTYVLDTLDPNGPTKVLFDEQESLDVKNLRAIAALRLCLAVGAEVVCSQLLTMHHHSSNRSMPVVLKALSDICDYAETKGILWPRRFLAMVIRHKYGSTVFDVASIAQHLRHITPKELEQTAGQACVSDFMVIGLDQLLYEKMRTAVAHCILDTKIEALQSVMQEHHSSEADVNMHCALALCSVFVRNYFKSRAAGCVADEVKKTVEDYAVYRWPAAKVLQRLLAGVVKNSLSDKLQIAMGCSATDVMTVLLVLRLAVGLLVKERPSSDVTKPLATILEAPSEMHRAYFPTMPHDPFLEIKEVLKNTNSDNENLMPYACPNGHIYYIGNCGRAYVLSKCPECGYVIGGTGHIAADGNREVKPGEDNTKPGHILGSATTGKSVTAERDLTPQSCIILRAILHSALYISAIINGSDQVEQLVQPRQENLLQFLWNHLKHDIECLQSALSKSFDDCLVFLHVVVARLVTSDTQGDYSWSSHDARRTWEKEVHRHLLLPACQEVDKIIDEGSTALHSDKDDSSVAVALARLLKEVYSSDSSADNTSSSISLRTILNSADVWRYRESPGVDHFIHRFENSDTSFGNERCRQYSALNLFLRIRSQLAAVRFLPAILSLIHSISREFGRKVDMTIANDLTIGQFLDKYIGGRLSHYRPLLDSFYEAWKAVSPRLGHHTFWYGGRRFNMPIELCAKVTASDDSPLRVLLPGLRGLGLSTLTLVTYLAKTQNDFLSEYARISREWLPDDIPLLSVVPAQLIAFDGSGDLLPIVLSNCEYLLEAGGTKSVKYNFESIQQQIMDRFVRHKPLILLSSEENGVDAIPCFLFREDLANGYLFEKLHSILPQKPLPQELKEVMQKEYRGKVSELSDMLVVIDQAVGFLVTSAIREDSNVPLVQYLRTVLHIDVNEMWTPLRDTCYPCHVKALWLLLSLERARALSKNKQECFDEVDDIYRQPLDDQEITASNLVKSLKKRKLDMVVEKIPEILYEFIVLELAAKRRKTLPGEDADDEVAYLPTFPLLATLSEYAEKIAESSGLDEALISSLKELCQEYSDIKLQHSAAVWRTICNL